MQNLLTMDSELVEEAIIDMQKNLLAF